MLPGDRKVGELWCSEVLEHLSEYLDGELPADTVALVEGHVSQCDNCARFGAEFGTAVTTLRQGLREPAEISPAARRRLRARLADAPGGTPG